MHACAGPKPTKPKKYYKGSKTRALSKSQYMKRKKKWPSWAAKQAAKLREVESGRRHLQTSACIAYWPSLPFPTKAI